ncbi:MAG: peptidyl-prolyl cis-trans isomerase [bacterium]
MTRLFGLTVLGFWVFMIFNAVPGAQAQEASDVIAKVGDQVITFSEIDTLINSSSIIGLDIPAYGTPGRNTARLSILDKMISADLLYLDALKNDADKDPDYGREAADYDESMLAVMYKEKFLVGEIPVTGKEIQDFYKTNIQKGTELTDDMKLAIEASIRKNKFKDRVAGMRERLRKDISVSVKEENLRPEDDGKREDTAVAAAMDSVVITWGEVKKILTGGPGKSSMADRVEAMNRFIDNRLMVNKAREEGLDKDLIYQSRVNEFRKTHLINFHRSQLVERFTPTEEEIDSYFEKNKDKIAVADVRKIQMVVLKSKEEAEQVKKKIDSGEITIFEAARDFSIDPNAKQTLGEMGWVSRSTGFPGLEKLTFSLKAGELGGPVESPAGWHLVKVLDVRDSMYQDINDKGAREKTRRMYIHEKLDQYTSDLRKKVFPVEVYEDVFNRITGEEIDRIQKKMGTPPGGTK